MVNGIGKKHDVSTDGNQNWRYEVDAKSFVRVR
jgi:hypothetical protein